jgi:predicted RNA-binding Zn ribbon-like protein
MTEPRPAPLFIGDDRALDFLNTVAAPWGEQLEWLADGTDLLGWLEQAGIAPAAVLAQFRRDASSRKLEAVALQARELREWFRGFVATHAGKPLTRAALGELAPLNRLLARDEAFQQIEAAQRVDAAMAGDHGALRQQSHRRWSRPDTLLLPVAQAIADLVCEKDFALVRKCENSSCTLWFLDVSKAHARRWCSMAVCGNRVKAAAHRQRMRRNRGERT